MSFEIPSDMVPPADVATMDCQPLSNIIRMSCTINGRKVTVLFEEFELADSAFTWSIAGIKNPGSTKPSQSFANVDFLDADGFIVSRYSETPVTVTNSFPANLAINSPTLLQGSLKPSEVTDYEIIFTPVNALPTTGSIQVTYPLLITLKDGSATECEVSITGTSFTDKCLIDDSARTITIKGVFASSPGYSGPISIKLQNVQNAINNKPGNGFVIQTYWDEQLNFFMDRLLDFILLPQYECKYPCQDCLSSEARDVCTACWQSPDDPSFLQDFGNGTVTCRPKCELGFTTNGNVDKICSPCHESCLRCRDNGQVGDYKICESCSPSFPYSLDGTDSCLADCELGMFYSTETSCSFCKDPCEGCSRRETNCTSCYRDSPIP